MPQYIYVACVYAFIFICLEVPRIVGSGLDINPLALDLEIVSAVVRTYTQVWPAVEILADGEFTAHSVYIPVMLPFAV